jgi:hypothetical protein
MLFNQMIKVTPTSVAVVKIVGGVQRFLFSHVSAAEYIHDPATIQRGLVQEYSAHWRRNRRFDT